MIFTNHRLRRIFNISVVLLTILSYFSLRIPPHVFWPAAFLSYGFPILIFLNLLLLILALVQKRMTAFIWFILFILGAPYLLRTVRFNTYRKTDGTTRVLSFNARLFYKPNVYKQFSSELFNWVKSDTSSIKCIQEFISVRSPEFNIAKTMKESGYNGFVFKAYSENQDFNPGLAIFTKFEIINSGIIWQESKTQNAAIFADLKKNNSVIRVYNLHLSSMSLKAYPSDWKGKLLHVYYQLKTGSIKRSIQINTLLNHMNTSPYPYLVCGDFNETPYSYVYSEMRSKLTNAFEKRGQGFGFTLNQKPYYLRIDHQFFSKEFKVQKYTVDRSMRISDHFPTYGYYILPE
ncbi:MAG TPA: endonuclease/exonuclease/phosphatase family protein [Cyclobacteriaceae bacterium]|mgnify:CR=1 FL=1|jgi:endonuclease/exonuclease/phosphatase family metal-dependent hydrolase|nr:endonuclease/exonuclease/phosphatase family protein [Cytophagales bacterium]HRE68668.1 endonuclease/exonuclease/phosphatase family protein [Cyclobacteriaceae bacterium]HRF35142.1 endonuclease/exonuclease/phosphatase family protein [Cyclobacteriaceae bacterium]